MQHMQIYQVAILSIALGMLIMVAAHRAWLSVPILWWSTSAILAMFSLAAANGWGLDALIYTSLILAGMNLAEALEDRGRR